MTPTAYRGEKAGREVEHTEEASAADHEKSLYRQLRYF